MAESGTCPSPAEVVRGQRVTDRSQQGSCSFLHSRCKKGIRGAHGPMGFRPNSGLLSFLSIPPVHSALTLSLSQDQSCSTLPHPQRQYSFILTTRPDQPVLSAPAGPIVTHPCFCCCGYSTLLFLPTKEKGPYLSTLIFLSHPLVSPWRMTNSALIECWGKIFLLKDWCFIGNINALMQFNQKRLHYFILQACSQWNRHLELAFVLHPPQHHLGPQE